MVKRIQWVSVLAVTTTLASAGCGTAYKRIKCDHSSIVVLKDPAKAFPMYTKTFQASFDLANAGRDSLLKVNARTSVATTMHAMYDTLDAIHADIRDFLITGYNQYVMAMCLAGTDADRAREANEAFHATQDSVLSYARRMRELAIAIDRAKAQNSAWDEAFALTTKVRGSVPSGGKR